MDKEKTRPEKFVYCCEVITDEDYKSKDVAKSHGSIKGLDYYIRALNSQLQHICDITEIIPQITLSDGYVMIPDNSEEPAIKYFYEHYVAEEIGAVAYRDYDPCNIIVRLKDNWKNDCIWIVR